MRVLDRLCERPVGLYAAAALRIGCALLVLLQLVREFPSRREAWGPASPWPQYVRGTSYDRFGLLDLSSSMLYFELFYLASLLVCALFALGWHPRLTSVLFALVVVSFNFRAPMMVLGGQRMIQLLAIYLIFAACGQVWSLHRSSLRPLTIALHNLAMFVIAAQVCTAYLWAGLSKLEGPTWRDGTALGYALQLSNLRVWPELSDLVRSNGLLVMVASYAAVFVSASFPFTLFSRWLKYPALLMLVSMHLGIAVLMGLPQFSAAMIVADFVFIPDRLWQRAGAWVRRRTAEGPADESTGPSVRSTDHTS
ncbi:hypothetical protein Lesp02_29380 [Lentzea sp. NBRC 105346]|uniref:HTTM domain-containing protein n=1 Tax=Lentzea sp. NBRC 105346 TaxID=3032205 RepID=UPI0024A3E84E|nr:HTTM domain-containing protein [Lentzea sp. NBRC 105346]GLZ30749.1 hypothetical protein Lesp02_29380 [Lentzea sp. NBRC 105346]